jgi:hypothetical protein
MTRAYTFMRWCMSFNSMSWVPSASLRCMQTGWRPLGIAIAHSKKWHMMHRSYSTTRRLSLMWKSWWRKN